jgi:hypothetical protein
MSKAFQQQPCFLKYLASKKGKFIYCHRNISSAGLGWRGEDALSSPAGN